MHRYILFWALLLTNTLLLGQEYSEVVPIIRVSPSYPVEQLEAKQEGWVNVQFDVNTAGGVENAQVLESQPSGVFDESAINAVNKFKFKPRIIDGQAVTSTVSQIIEFELPNATMKPVVETQPQLSDNQMDYELTYVNEKKKYYSTLKITDTNTGKAVDEITLDQSVGQQPFLAQSSESPYLFYYYRESKEKGQIKIYQASNLKLLHEVSTEPLFFTVRNKQNNYFFSLNPNGTDLMAMVSKNKTPKLITVNGQTGKTSIKFEFSRNTLLKGTADMRYLWAMKVNPSAENSARFNNKHNNKLQFIRTDTYETFREISLNEKLISALMWGDVIQLMFEYSRNDSKYRVMLLDLADNSYYDDFYSSKKPIVYEVDGPYPSLMLAGMSSDENKHIKIAKLKGNKLTDLSNKNFYIDYNEVNYSHQEGSYYMYVYGDGAYGRLNINNPEDFLRVQVPMDVDWGFYNSTFDVVYLKERKGPEIAMVDLNTASLVNTAKVGSTDKKVGQVLGSILTMALTAPTGYMVTPLGGFRRSDTKLFLNSAADRVFAINYKTNDVTSFAANDLSDKHIVDTGKDTFQIIQANFEADLPVVVIGMRKVTFLSAHTGRLLKQIDYDKPLNITDDHQLSYVVDDQISSISLAYMSE